MKNRTLLQYVALALTWGSSFFFVSVGLQGLSPVQIVLARLVLGAIALGIYAAITRQALPREPMVWLHLSVVAILLCVAPFLLYAWAQQTVPSGVASILNATTPLMTMLAAMALLPEERPNRSRVAGLVLGFVGVLIVLAPWGHPAGADGAGTVTGQLACLAATACYGAAFVYLRRFVSPRGLAAVPVATVQVGLAAVLMLALAPFIAMQPVHLNLEIVLAMLALGVLGTGLAYAWNTRIVAVWGATAASTVTYLTPLVGMLLGTLLLGESMGWYQPIGAVIVVVGILVSQQRLGAVRAALTRRSGARAASDLPRG